MYGEYRYKFKCPECGGDTTLTGGVNKGEHYCRYRKCNNCGKIFKTLEKYIENPNNWKKEWYSKR